MSPSTIVILIVLLGLLCLLLDKLHPDLWQHRKNERKLPPGPRSLPIIGNLHMLGKLPHQTFHHLAKTYGPIMSIRLGHVPAIVISSPQAAELFLKTHDAVFASRPKVQSAEYFSYGSTGLAFTQYGSYWRNVRKLCTLQLLSSSKVESFAPMRRAELGLMVESLKKSAAAKEVVDLSGKVGELIEEIMFKMILGRSRDNKFNLKGLVRQALDLAGTFNISDYVPYLAPLDLQGLTRSLKAVSKSLDEVLEKIIDEHEQNTKQKQHKDFVDVMVSMLNQPMNPHDYEEQVQIINRTNIKAIILDMIAAAIDASATAVDWALSELLRHPRVRLKLQNELGSVVGMTRMVEETTDLAKLTYLDLVVKETLRLHPVAPLLIPHESIEDITIDGYHIPKKSRILVNIWAMGRDRKIWSDNAEEFFPERFVGSNIDLRGGRDFELIPFGSGRRGCPGMQLGLTMVRLVVAQLMHCFDWELPDGMQPDDIDMSEKPGLSVPSANHLLAKPTYRFSS